MDLEDSKEMWDRLKIICSKIGQRVLYLILQELLYYFAANKPKSFNKPVVEIFTKVKYLYKQLKAAMIEGKDLFETIAIVIALDMLHNDFDTTTASMLKTKNKFIDEIFTIIQLKKAKLKNKRVIRNVSDVAPAFCTPLPKRKATYDNLCYNCQQKRHFGQDCSFSDCRRKIDVLCQLKS